MGETTKIQWCDHTFNPWRGCTKVAPGCANCYADTQSKRNPSVLGIWGPNGTRVVAAEKAWGEPLKWNKAAAEAGVRRRVFCASLADVFEDWREELHWSDGTPVRCAEDSRTIIASYDNEPYSDADYATLDDVRARLFALIDATPKLDWLVLTKRPENVRRMWPAKQDARPIFPGMPGPLGEPVPCVVSNAHRPNVWLLTSVSDQATADAAIPELLNCRDLVPVLGVSYEPAIGPVDWSEWFGTSYHDADDGDGQTGDVPYNHGLDWIIVGSESGHKRRPMDVEWAASTARQCREAGVAFFMKQMEVAGRVTGDIEMFPDDMRVREWPVAKGGG